MSHDVVEIISCHETIVVQVGLEEHVIYLLLRKVLPQLLSHLLQLEGCYFALN